MSSIFSIGRPACQIARFFSQAYLPTSVDPQENPRLPAHLVCHCIALSRLRRAVLASAKWTSGTRRP
jgi:hypothetical protein